MPTGAATFSTYYDSNGDPLGNIYYDSSGNVLSVTDSNDNQLTDTTLIGNVLANNGYVSDTPQSVASLGGSTPAQISTGSVSSTGSLGTIVTSLSNTALQWFQAVTKGVSGQLVVPQPTQATGSQLLASLTSSASGYIGLIVVAILVIIGIKVATKK